MLAALTIQDVVLIERLTLELEAGLAVLTGETGAGKSILLDSLGLALGARADARLVRRGAKQASVTALFELPAGHPAYALLEEQGFAAPEDASLTLRRVVTAEGRSRAFIDDQPASVGLLRSLGDSLVEIQGQFESRGLLDPRNHRELLDAFGGLETEAKALGGLFAAWRDAAAAAQAAQDELDAAKQEEETLRHAVEELTALAPEAGEVERLAEERQMLQHLGSIVDAITEAERLISGSNGGEAAIAQAARQLERVVERAGERLDPALDSLERALAEIEEASRQLSTLSADLDLEPNRLEQVDERFFALKELARKHRVEADALPDFLETLSGRLAQVESGDRDVERLRAAAKAAEETYRQAARALSERRKAAAEALDEAVTRELPPLKLDRARFVTALTALPAEEWTARGAETIQFLVATNPGSDPGPIGKIASGGELARFLLAVKVVLARLSPQPTLIFDEVDAGIGGATAAAVGARLARLAEERQILVVTHSPQVAARGHAHLRVMKEEEGEVVRTGVTILDSLAREEEIARMLAGSEITKEARQAAQRLLEVET